MASLSNLLMPDMSYKADIKSPSMNKIEHAAYQEHVDRAIKAGREPLSPEEFRKTQQGV